MRKRQNTPAPGSTGLDSQELAEWLYGKTLGHPYFLAFISRELWSHCHARPFADAMNLWPIVFSRLEQGKFNTDLAASQKTKLRSCGQSRKAITTNSIQGRSCRNSRTNISNAWPREAY